MPLVALLAGLVVVALAFFRPGRRLVATFVDLVDGSVGMFAIRRAFGLDTTTARQRRIDRRHANEEADLARRIGVTEAAVEAIAQRPEARAPTRLVAVGEPLLAPSSDGIPTRERMRLVVALTIVAIIGVLGFGTFQGTTGRAGAVLAATATPETDLGAAAAPPPVATPTPAASPAGVAPASPAHGPASPPTASPVPTSGPTLSFTTRPGSSPIPVALSPSVRLTGLSRRLVGGVAGGATAPVRLTWKLRGGSAPVARIGITASFDGGAPRVIARLPGSARSLTVRLPVGRAVRFAVVATGSDRTISATATWPPVRAALVQDTSAGLALSGPWLAAGGPSLSGGTVHFSRSVGARARLTFSGSDVAWVGTRTPTSGRAQVRLDGRLVATVDLRDPAVRYRLVAYRWHAAKAGRHTIEIRVVGDGRVDVDTFVVLR